MFVILAESKKERRCVPVGAPGLSVYILCSFILYSQNICMPLFECICRIVDFRHALGQTLFQTQSHIWELGWNEFEWTTRAGFKNSFQINPESKSKFISTTNCIVSFHNSVIFHFHRPLAGACNAFSRLVIGCLFLKCTLGIIMHFFSSFSQIQAADELQLSVT